MTQMRTCPQCQQLTNTIMANGKCIICYAGMLRDTLESQPKPTVHDARAVTVRVLGWAVVDRAGVEAKAHVYIRRDYNGPKLARLCGVGGWPESVRALQPYDAKCSACARVSASLGLDEA